MIIRPYRKEDYPAIRDICVQTGARGQVQEMFCDTDLFARLWLKAFLETEPESCFVACDEGKLVGYLVGSVRPGFKSRAIGALIPEISLLTFRQLTGKYRHHPPSKRFAKWLLVRSWRETPATPTGSALAHFNVDERYRGSHRVGEELLNAFFAHMSDCGVDRFSGTLFTTPTKRPAELYLRMGFTVYESRKCSLFEDPTYLVTITTIPPERLPFPKTPSPTRRVSVVIPAHNEAEYLRRLLTSLKDQTVSGFQVVVVCDNCSDNTEAVAEEFGACTVVGKFGHAGIARNAGIEAAGGELLILLDADTIAPADMVANVMAAESRGASFGAAYLRNESSNLVGMLWVAGQNLMTRLSGCLYGTMIFVRRDCIAKVGMYDESLKWAEDVEFSLRLRLVGKRGMIATRMPYSERRFIERGRFRELIRRIGASMKHVPTVLWRVSATKKQLKADAKSGSAPVGIEPDQL
ncbi:MAG: glycosyltransferase [Fimbriimonadaceae bacterium]